MNILRKVIDVGIGVSFFAMATVTFAQVAPDWGLFESVAVPATRANPSVPSDTHARSRYVTVAIDRLGDALGVQHADGARKLQLNFFSDANYSVTVDREERRSANDYTLFGAIEDIPLGRCTIVVQGDKVTGNCSSPQGMYAIRYHANGQHVLYEIDQSKFPDELEPIVVSPSGDPAIEPAASDPDPLSNGEIHPDDAATDDDGSIIDMLVVYTTNAKNASSNIRGEIQLAIDETNQSYINSGIAHRVRLVGTSETSYTGTNNFCDGSNSDLARLRATSDGFMDNVHSLRNAYGADQVTLILEAGDACGCAYFMNTVSTDFKTSAFSVIKRSCATGYYSFGHELGHNMGMHHDCYVSPGLTPYNYNHGYVNLTDKWRTIMAYNTQCADNGFNCTRIQYYSNPSVSYGGDPTGIAGSTGCKSDNQLVAANTDLTVSRFRDGYCYKSGVVERVTQYPDDISSSNYIYVKPYPLASYYNYFRTTDDNIAQGAARAAKKKTSISIRGHQSCFNSGYDYGGEIDYLIYNP